MQPHNKVSTTNMKSALLGFFFISRNILQKLIIVPFSEIDFFFIGEKNNEPERMF